MLPSLTTVPVLSTKKTPAKSPMIVPEAALVTDPPAPSSTPQPLVPAMLPSLTRVPALPLMQTPVSPPVSEAEVVLVTDPPELR
jgi:hypothetical protein